MKPNKTYKKNIQNKSMRYLLNAYLNALKLAPEEFNTRRKVPHDTSCFAKCIAVHLRLRECGYTYCEIANILGGKLKAVEKYGERYGYLHTLENTNQVKLTPFQVNVLCYLRQLRQIPNLTYENHKGFVDRNMVRDNPYWIAGLYYETT